MHADIAFPLCASKVYAPDLPIPQVLLLMNDTSYNDGRTYETITSRSSGINANIGALSRFPLTLCRASKRVRVSDHFSEEIKDQERKCYLHFHQGNPPDPVHRDRAPSRRTRHRLLVRRKVQVVGWLDKKGRSGCGRRLT